MVKAQAPLNDYGEIYLDLFSFVRRQSEFAVFGAITSVVALFLFSIQGGVMFKNLRLKIKHYFRIVSDPIAIPDQEACVKAHTWLKRAMIICGICSILGILYALLINALFIKKIISLGFLSVPISFILGQWSFLGVAAFLLNAREIFNIKKMVELGKIGYTIGKEFKETHINVTHEFGNQYKITSHTENKGCLFAFIAVFIRFLGWMYFSVIVGAFLTLKKLILTIRNVKDYQEK